MGRVEFLHAASLEGVPVVDMSDEEIAEEVRRVILDRAVVNAGPLVALSLAGRLDLLPALFEEFWIPDTVFREVAVAGLGHPLHGEHRRERGRRIAHQVYGLPLKGAAGLLVEARRCGLLNDLRSTLLDLKRVGYYLSDAVIEGACKAAELH